MTSFKCQKDKVCLILKNVFYKTHQSFDLPEIYFKFIHQMLFVIFDQNLKKTLDIFLICICIQIIAQV